MDDDYDQAGDDPLLAIILPIGIKAPAEEPSPLRCPCCHRLLLIERVIVRAGFDDDHAA